jgi:hypothetical protein
MQSEHDVGPPAEVPGTLRHPADGYRPGTVPPSSSLPGQDRSEWQIEWQTGARDGLPEPVSASLCARSSWSGTLPAVTEPCGDTW